VPPSTLAYNATLEFRTGEVHFPFFDAENNDTGFILERETPVLASDTLAKRRTIYYDNRYNYTGSNTYDYSLCANGETPDAPDPNVIGPGGGADCYGAMVAGSPRSALDGVDSTGGAHRWTDTSGPQASGFGNLRGIDTWAFIPSPPVDLERRINIKQADLQMQKTATLQGTSLTYQLVVTNNGPSNITGATVTDAVPASVVDVTWECAITSGTGACGSASGSGNAINTTLNLNANAAATYTIRGRVTQSGQLDNTATVQRPNDVSDPNPNNNTSTATVTVPEQADLELTKVADTATATVGQNVVYTIQLTNKGPSNATNVQVTDKLPAALTFVAATPAQGTYESTTGVWSVGTLNSGASTTLQITAQVNAAATSTNSAQVTASDQPDFDSTPNNMGDTPAEDDEAQATITTTAAQQTPTPVADLELDKTLRTPPARIGANAVFRITLTNRGPDTATNVAITDELPAGLVFVSAAPAQGSYDESSSTWSVGTLNSGASTTLDMTVRVVNLSGITNTAQVSRSDQSDPDSTPNNNVPSEDDQDTATIPVADLSLRKAVTNPNVMLGEQTSFIIEVRNDGPDNATGVQVTDQLPAGLVYVSHTASQGNYDEGSGVWDLGTLNNGNRATLNLMVRVETTDEASNSAEITASDQIDTDSTPNNNVPSEDDQDTATITPGMATPRLASFKRDTLVDDNDGNGIPSAGDGLEYAITISNVNDAPALDVLFRDKPDSNTTLVAGSVQSSQGSVTTGNNQGDTEVAIELGTIDGNQQVTITFEVTIADPLPDGVTQVANQGIVTSSNTPSVLTDDPDTGDPDDPTVTPLTPTPVLDAFKDDSVVGDNDGNGVTTAGDTLRYTITIVNKGNVDAENVIFRDGPDSNTTLVAGSVQSSQGSVTVGNSAGERSVEVDIGRLPAGAEATVTFDVDIANPLPPNVVHLVNQGTVTARNTPSVPTDDPATPTSDDPTITPVTTIPTVDAYKRDGLLFDNDNNGIASAGDRLLYVISLANTSNVVATDIVYDDQPDRNSTLAAGSVQTTQGSIERGNSSGDRSIQIDVGNIRPGEEVTISYEVTINDPLPSRVNYLENQGVTTGSNIPSVPTDDPDTTEIDDPTRTPIGDTPRISAAKRSSVLIDRDSSDGASASDTLIYFVELRNSGNSAITEAVFADEPDPNTTLVAGSVQSSQGAVTRGNTEGDRTIEIDLGTIPASGSVLISYQVVINDPLPDEVDRVVNQGIVTSNNLPPVRTDDPLDPNDSRETEVIVKTIPNLKAFKTDILLNDPENDGILTAGDTLLYVVNIPNNGNLAATDVTFTDQPDPNTTLIVGSVKSSQGNITSGNSAGDSTVTIEVGTIPPDGEVRISFEVTINDSLPESVAEVNNQGIVTSPSLPTTPPDVPTGETEIPTDDPDEPGDTDITTTPLTAIDIIKRVDPPRVGIGQEATYTLVVRNVSRDVILSPVEVVDTLPEGISYVAGSATPQQPAVNGRQLVWDDIADGEGLAPGDTIELTYRATGNAVGEHVNTVVVTADTPTGTVTDSDETTLFVVDPGVQIYKFANNPEFVDGEITFTILITNTGLTTLDVVPLTDTFSGPVEYIGGTVPPDEIDNQNQVLRWNDLTEQLGNMEPGQTFRIDTTFRLTEEPQGEIVVKNVVIVNEATDIFDNIPPETTSTATVTQQSTPTAIELLRFRATPQQQGVLVEWVTGLELDSWGFHLLRSSDGTRQHAERITPELVLARGRGSGGASYTWHDSSAQPGTHYTYWLQEIELDGTIHEYGPTTTAGANPQTTSHALFLPLIQ
jgi:uncharacterized repeat protein (TIGR01451 family)